MTYPTWTKVDTKAAHGWIQWKGTNVCMDVRCPCGRVGHIDADFAYFVRCACGKVYEVDPHVALHEVDYTTDEMGCPPIDASDEDFSENQP